MLKELNTIINNGMKQIRDECKKCCFGVDPDDTLSDGEDCFDECDAIDSIKYDIMDRFSDFIDTLSKENIIKTLHDKKVARQ